MINNNIKKNLIFIFSIIIILLYSNLCFSKSKSAEYPVAPVGEEKNAISEGVIIHNEKSPKSPTPLDPNPKNSRDIEKEKYDTNIIDVDSIFNRIEYFSPTYQYALSSAESVIRGQLYAFGAKESVYDTITDVVNEYKKTKSETYDTLNDLKKKYKLLKNQGKDDSDPDVDNILSGITECNVAIAQINFAIDQYDSGRSAISSTLNMINRAESKAGLSSTKYNIAKELTSTFLTYKQLETTIKLLERKKDLMKKIYEITSDNVKIGLSTVQDRIKAENDYKISKNEYDALNATMIYARDMLLINLGYDINDYANIEFKEPKLNLDVIKSINPVNDYEHAYNSNAQYKAAHSDNQNQKNQSDDYNKNIRLKYENLYRNKVISELDNMYANLMASLLTYEGSLYLKEAYYYDSDKLKNMKKNDLVSNIDIMQLELQNLQSKIQFEAAKYNLINAYYMYFYATYGVTTVS